MHQHRPHLFICWEIRNVTVCWLPQGFKSVINFCRLTVVLPELHWSYGFVQVSIGRSLKMFECIAQNQCRRIFEWRLRSCNQKRRNQEILPWVHQRFRSSEPFSGNNGEQKTFDYPFLLKDIANLLRFVDYYRFFQFSHFQSMLREDRCQTLLQVITGATFDVEFVTSWFHANPRFWVC